MKKETAGKDLRKKCEEPNMGHVGKCQDVSLSLCLDSREVPVGAIHLEYTDIYIFSFFVNLGYECQGLGWREEWCSSICL